MQIGLLAFLFITATLLTSIHSQCNHPIFCSSAILQAAADSNLFKDSKTFVDLTLKFPIEEVLQNFKTQKPNEFFQNNFHQDPDLLLFPATFSDYQEYPLLLTRIADPEYKKFASQLNKRWNQLGKRVNLSAAQTVGTCKQNCSTFLPELDGLTMLVPGGRFRQNYYWDTYWIILGLIMCDMFKTAESLLDNFATIIRSYGFIPNGFRQYYLTRSQPPFFFLMVKDLAAAYEEKGQYTKAKNLQQRMFDVLNIQHQYWQKTHSSLTFIEGSVFTINQYRANTKTPRPQSYKQDVQTTKKVMDPTERARIWSGISSMAESGWDFSSRWLRSSQLTTTDIELIAPSDLNALLGMMERYLADLSKKYDRPDLSEKYTLRFTERIKYFNTIKKDGRFPDFQFNKSPFIPDIVYPTDYLPYIFLQEKYSVTSIYNLVVNPQASILRTGQQWDSPNVWAPNNWIIHQISPQYEPLIYAGQWLSTTYCSFIKYDALYEKYRSSRLGERGEGGQYAPQIGFGWTNGLALYYIGKYPTMSHPQC